jgi:hypothetical protein
MEVQVAIGEGSNRKSRRGAMKECFMHVRKRWVMVVASSLWLGAGGLGSAQTGPSACGLLTAAELEAALGGKAGALSGSSQGTSRICTGTVGRTTVMIRVAERSPEDTGERERKGLEIARKMGAQVEVQKEGELTCSTLIPPPGTPQMGYNTTCTLLREGLVVGVEVTAQSRQDMAAIPAVKELVQKARSRL